MYNDSINIELLKSDDGSMDTTVKNINGEVIETHNHNDLYLLLSLLIRVVTIFWYSKGGE